VYLVTTVANGSKVHDEIRRRINPENACCYTVQKLLYHLLSKIVKIIIYKENSFAICLA
jgi:hypothetical protein